MQAASAELDEERGRATYRGSVQLDQGTLRVLADTMVIDLEGNKVVRITAEGDRAHYQQQLRRDRSLVKANAATIVYHTEEERIELIGDAYLTQDDNEFTGDLINYNMRAGKVDASSSQTAPVKMIFQPAERQP